MVLLFRFFLVHTAAVIVFGEIHSPFICSHLSVPHDDYDSRANADAIQP